MVANRSVGTGLTASAVISSWMYSTALLGAPYLTYWYGIALPVWWANGQSIMICMFGWLAIQAKLKVPNAHTLLELIRVRYGTVAHILWIVLCTINNLLIFSSMIVGASAAVSALTGMNLVAATYLLPLGVVIYTYFGGIRATFLTDYIHTFIIMIVLVWFTIKIFTIKEINSIGALYDTLVTLSKKYPVKGNHDGSYLTMTSKESIYFGIIHILYVLQPHVQRSRLIYILEQTLELSSWIQASGRRYVYARTLRTVSPNLCCQGFAAEVSAAVPGYILGGNAYFAIPFAFGTVMGLGALAVEQTPSFPTYPQVSRNAMICLPFFPLYFLFRNAYT